MELKEYCDVIKSNKKTIAKIAILTALFAVTFSVLLPKSYEVSTSLFINKSGTQNTDLFKYDGYYALQSGEIIADNMEKMLQSPEIVDVIYQKAGVDSNFKSIKSYKKKFIAHKMSNQYVEVSFVTSDKESAQKIASALTEIANQKLLELNSTSQQEVSFSIENNQSIIVEKKPDLLLNAAIGIISGLFLGIFISFLKKYFS